MTAGGGRFFAGALVAFAAALSFAACSSEHAPAGPARECAPVEFRACETDACRGVQECVDPGYWTDCDCVIVDASYADVPHDQALGDAALESAPD